jgi:anaerobic magnesium-protoporphyrin IX monomethyl ester cyclase
MKILLLNPPMFDRNPWGISNKERLRNPPIGIAYIAAVLERAGYNVILKDLYNADWHKVYQLINNETPDIVGITCLTDMRASVFRLVYMVKACSKEIRVVLGGPHATLFPEQLQEHLPIDAVVLGEGEETFLDLIRAWEKGGNLETVDGIVYRDRKNDVIRRNKPQKRIEDLDFLPIPAYYHFDFDEYVPPSYLKGFVYRGTNLGEVKWISINTSRGCPYRCGFCSEPVLWNNIWRSRSTKSIIAEMEVLYRDFGYRYFNLAEDSFTINRKRVIDLCQEIVSRGLNVTWVCNSRVDTVSREMLSWMAKAGCAVIAYGVESGSSRILKNMRKQITPNQVIKAVRLTREAGIPYIAIYLIVGYPGETDATIEETLDLIRKIEPVQLRIGLLTVYPKTDLHDLAQSKGFIDDEYWLTEAPSPIYTAEHSLETLKNWKAKLLNASLPPPAESVFRKLTQSVRQLLWKTTGIWVERRPRF